MHKNPFSPSFSIRPERFYGRKRELELMRSALDNPDSSHRFLFLTGTRGCGKTSLLHQFVLIAEEGKWATLETTYRDAVEALQGYTGAGTSTTTKSFSPSLSADGASISALEISNSKTEQPAVHFAHALVDRLGKAKRSNGLFIAIDEIQKISEQDMEEICHAVQAAKTQGLPIALVLAGLPGAYGRIRRYRGCTFTQRMERCRLGMMGISDTDGFLRTMFALIPEMRMRNETIDEIAQFTAGHPYLMQLVGSHLYDVAAETGIAQNGARVEINKALTHEAERRALADYQRNILDNLLHGLRNGTKAYLRAMCDICDESSTARTSDIARALGKTLQECSEARARVIDLQLAVPSGHGELRFELPYFPLAFERADVETCPDPSDTWKPRKTPFAT